MPPKKTGKQLTAAQKDTLKRWIEQGAKYEPHWIYIPPQRVEPPMVAGIGHPVDRFIRARLAAEGVKPSPEADRATLIRRVTLDLTGLPPSPLEVDAFMNDARGDAYERVVERLLASEHFGERWARWWLDLAHYGGQRWLFAGFHPARGVALPAVGGGCVQSRSAVRSIHHRAARGRPAAGCDHVAANGHRFSAQHAEQSRGRRGPRGVSRESDHRSHDDARHDVARADHGLRAVPRSQVRRDLAARVLPALRVLQQRRRSEFQRAAAGRARSV